MSESSVGSLREFVVPDSQEESWVDGLSTPPSRQLDQDELFDKVERELHENQQSSRGRCVRFASPGVLRRASGTQCGCLSSAVAIRLSCLQEDVRITQDHLTRVEASLDGLLAQPVGCRMCVEQEGSDPSRRVPRLVREDAERVGADRGDGSPLDVMSSGERVEPLYDGTERPGRKRRR